MIRSYLIITLRSLLKNKVYSFINIFGLTLGMTVAMVIGLWIYDEVSFDKCHEQYDRIVQVLQNSKVGGGVSTYASLPMPLSRELQENYSNDFEKVAATITLEQPLAFEDKVFSKIGYYAEYPFVQIISLDMLKGTQAGLKAKHSVLLSETTAEAIFGALDPLGKTINLNNSYALEVGGVYKDLPKNSRFYDLGFIAPIQLLFSNGASTDNWYSSSFQIYATLSQHAQAEAVSSKIKNILFEHSQDQAKPELLLFPMRKWRLYGDFTNGVSNGGRIVFVWVFSIIGLFILTLACINFMNLSTAQSEKRSKEIGIRKAVGSERSQLIVQFMGESLIVTGLSLCFSLLLLQLVLGTFNALVDKKMVVLWANPGFLLAIFLFSLFTGLLAGSYPALYLSSFKPVKVLKGTFKVGRLAAIPRKALVIFQFAISVALIIGTITIFRQIQFAKNRPVGYDRNGLVSILFPSELANYQAFKTEVLADNEVLAVAAAGNPTTAIYSSADNLNWKGKDPNRQEVFGTILVEPAFEEIVHWKMKEGRSFSEKMASDSMAFVFNEAAIKQMNLEKPIGETVQWHGKNWNIIGIVEDMVMASPFEPAVPTVFLMNVQERSFSVINFKLNPQVSIASALQKIEAVHKKFAPNSPFTYKFADQEYGLKFAEQERTGQLASIFAMLTIFISCLGLFGLAAFTAQQRTKEIGIRKTLGASVASITGLLSKDFLLLVLLAILIASPIAGYLMGEWLKSFTYRIQLEWWMFAAAGILAMVIAFLTIGFQSMKAALANPVKSLKSE
jgi:putative ABC transport system permease protein